MAAIIIPPPTDLAILEECADWLELVALVADDSNASAGDLERLLKRTGTFGSAANEDEAIEQHYASVFEVIARRVEAVADNYPFVLDGGILTRRSAYADSYVPYIFCLCLSYFRANHPAVAGLNPRLLFEHLAGAALEGYLGSPELLIFGTSRKAEFEKKGFADAISSLVDLMGEGGGFKDQPTLSKKDDHLDVAAVKTFPDKRHGKLVVFGQCATGNNWEEKLSEMDPQAFCRQWMSETITSTPSLVKTFFVPFVIPESRWRYVCNYAGIMFERLRVARYAPDGPTISNHRDPMLSWIGACLT